MAGLDPSQRRAGEREVQMAGLKPGHDAPRMKEGNVR